MFAPMRPSPRIASSITISSPNRIDPTPGAALRAQRRRNQRLENDLEPRGGVLLDLEAQQGPAAPAERFEVAQRLGAEERAERVGLAGYGEIVPRLDHDLQEVTLR